MANLAPIVLFTYNRPEHTKKTLEALALNILANESDLFVYSDGPKNQDTIHNVEAVRSVIKNITGFKSITIIERNENWGLAKSIIDGVTTTINKYEKIIVLEDDVVTSPYFLKFMNDALDYYNDEHRVWHISGWNYWGNSKGPKGAFFWYAMDCGGGWATWQNRWQYFEKNTDKLIAEFEKNDIYRFDIYGTEYMWGQVLDNKAGKINTWAIFWYATIFRKNGLCLSPTVSFTRNIGFDNTGVHCGESTAFKSGILCEKTIDFSAIKLEEDKKAVSKIMHFYKRLYKKRNLLIRGLKKIIRIIKKIAPPPPKTG